VNLSLEVECYSGHTFAERPTAFVWHGRRYQVERILKQWRSPDGPGFRLVTAGGEQFELIYHETKDEWSLIGESDFTGGGGLGWHERTLF
jgi:hypothetical protein